jgi:hypothetical protein
MGLISNGTTIFDAGALDSGLAKGSMTLIKKLTASSSANLTFIHGTANVVLDSTYKEYLFIVNNMHPGATSEVNFVFNMTTDGSNFNVEKQGTMMENLHNENNSTSLLRYGPDPGDLETGDLMLMGSINRDADGCGVCLFRLYNPASTTFLKHYSADIQLTHTGPRTYHRLAAGYANTTSAITGVRFLMNTGNIDTGTITLYGIS